MSEAKDYVTGVLIDLDKQYTGWQPLQTAADKALWPLLGRIWVEGATIDEDEDKRVELVAALERHPEVKGSKKWSPKGKLGYELLVTWLLGLKEKRSRKSQWLAALDYADERQVSPVPGELETWLGKIGGVDGAGELLRGESDDSEPPASLEETADRLAANAPEAPTVTAHVQGNLPAGLVLWLVRKTGEAEDEFKILKQSVELSKIKHFLGSEMRKGQAKKHNRVQVRNIEESSLRVINKIVLIKAGTDGGKLTSKAISRFVRALKRLESDRDLKAKYFDGEPGHQVRTGEKKSDIGEIYVMNEDAHELDPARYVSGAKREVMIPYKFDPSDMASTELAAKAYISSSSKRPEPDPEPPVSRPMVDLSKYAEKESSDQDTELQSSESGQ